MNMELPGYVLKNRRLVEELKSWKVNENFNTIKRENPLKIGNDKIQLILDENQIDTLDKLQSALESKLVKAPMHIKIVKNFIEEERKKEVIQMLEEDKQEDSK